MNLLFELEDKIRHCKYCDSEFEAIRSNHYFCDNKQCKRLFEQETRKYKKNSDEKKLNKQLNSLAEWLNKEMPIVKKKKIDLENIPYNKRF